MRMRRSGKHSHYLMLSCCLLMVMLINNARIAYGAPRAMTTMGKSDDSIAYNVAIDETLKLTSTANNAIWSSSNKKVATVSLKGLVTGKSEGTAIVTATSVSLESRPAKTIIGKLFNFLFPKVKTTVTKYKITVTKKESDQPVEPDDPDPDDPDPDDPDPDDPDPDDPDPDDPSVDKYLIDSDGDGLADAAESSYGTEPLKPDTDGDGLSDFEEILLGTNPIVADDCDQTVDTDSDGLSDYDEATKYHTDPFSKDSDSDGLTDYDELFAYNTDPLNLDSDGDTLSDGFEVEHGMNPNSSCSDGINNDNTVIIDQELSSYAISNSLLDSDNLAKPSIFGSVNGELSNNVFVSSSSDVASDDNRAIVGKPILIDGDDDYVAGLRLSFDLETYEGNSSSLIIVTLDEEGNYVPIDSTLEGTELSATINKSGTYFVLDIDEFLTSLGIDTVTVDNSEITTMSLGDTHVENESSDANAIIKDSENDALTSEQDAGITEGLQPMSLTAAGDAQEEYAAEVNEDLLEYLNEANEDLVSSSVSGQADIVFAIDTTGSMSSTINNVVTNVTSFATTLSSNYNVRVNYALIDFKDLEADGPGTTKVIRNGSSNWFSDVNSFASKVQELVASGGGDTPESDIDALETARRLDWRTGSNKFIILITDASYKTANDYGISSMEEEIELLEKDGINTSVVTTSGNRSNYQALYETTGGIYANIDSSTFSSSLLELAELIGESTSNGTWAILKNGYRYVKLTDEADQDNDGLSTAFELGETEEVDLSALIKARLALQGVPYEHYSGKTSLTVYNARSNPTREDSDDDGILDKDDDAPWKKGKANGIIGKLSLVTCYGDGWTSGHSFFAYQSYVKDSIDFSCLVNGWSRIDSNGGWTMENMKRDYTPISSYAIAPLEYVCVGNGALGGGESGSGNSSGTVGGSGDDSVGDANGVNYNMETWKFIANGKPTGAGVDFSYLSNTYISEEITEATLDKLISYLGQDEVNYWSLLHNCAKVAADGWNHISDTKVSAKGTAGWGIAATPSALRDNLRKIEGHAEDWQMSEAFK